MYPYKMSSFRQLLLENYTRRLAYAQHIHRELRNDFRYLNLIFSSDKRVFHSNGGVNKKVQESGVKTHTVVEVPHTSQNIVIWCGMHKTKALGHYFFSKRTVTGENYKRMVCDYAIPKKQNLPASPIFQQDDAPPHWSVDARSYSDTRIYQHCVAGGGLINSISAMVTRFDSFRFFLPGYVEDFVFICKNSISISHKA